MGWIRQGVYPTREVKLHGCFGRDREVEWLRAQYDAVATKVASGQFPGPRMAIVLAESGIGKSRLVQELYLRLTEDPLWDPADVDYWPPAFGDGEANLHVAPDMRGHVPKGPPRFVWLGARWQRPDERNAINRRSVLPDLRSAVRIHTEVQRLHGSAWLQVMARAQDVVMKEGLGTAADLAGFPFFGLVAASIRGIRDAVDAIAGGAQGYQEVERAEVQSEVDEVLGCLRTLFSGRGTVPTVLWLDDAQWIDPESLQFVHALWAEARRSGWPLLVVVTHWEREWRELAVAARPEANDGSLFSFKGQHGVEELLLQPAQPTALADYVATRLPGLTQQQRLLLVEKSGGNFLSMVENVGELIAEPMWFVGERLEGALTAHAVEHIREFKTQRQERVKQRFQQLASEVRRVLGWSTRLGPRFFPDLMAAFARERLTELDPTEAIDSCVDPYAVLGTPTPRQREFRDPLVHQVAREFHDTFLRADTFALEGMLRQQLSAWVTNSFTADGEMIWPDAADDEGTPPFGVWALTNEEQRDLLELARRELPLPKSLDMERIADVTPLRVLLLSILIEVRENRWSQVLTLCHALGDALQGGLPVKVLALQDLAWLANAAREAGALTISARLAAAELSPRRRLAAELGTPESRRELSMSLHRLGAIMEDRGDLPAAHTFFEEAFALDQRLVADLETPQSRRNLSIALNRLGGIEEELGDLHAARTRYTESCALTRMLVADLGTSQSREDLSDALSSLVGIEYALGDLPAARISCKECLALARVLVDELGTPESRRGLSVCLQKLGKIEEAVGNLTAARALYVESLGIARGLVSDLGDPASREGLSICLGCLGSIEEAAGNLPAAHALFEDSLALARELLADLGNPTSRRGLCNRLLQLGRIETSLGNPLTARERYEESLVLARGLAAELHTPESRLKMGVVLFRLGGIEEILGSLPVACRLYEESLLVAREILTHNVSPDNQQRVLHAVTAFGTCLGKLEEPAQAHFLLLAERHLAITLEDACHDQPDVLDGCASFWEASATVCDTLGDHSAAIQCATRGATLRTRIGDLSRKFCLMPAGVLSTTKTSVRYGTNQ